ncbi:MAG: DALR anticodon-binding domain-containing protein [Candidatus Pacebacteria bacterium]|nr:DALR anticodon-binding domain-containing protein [Candidatus Paceibacterota bacterium]
MQYSAVRAKSILRKAKEAGIASATKKCTESAHDLEKVLYRFPEIVERAASEYEPHYVTTYLTELAGMFNSYYANNQIISADDAYSPYRIALTEAFGIIMENGLALLGIEVPEKM